MDATDRQLAEIMIRQWTANLDDLRATADTPYADIAFCLERVAYWSAKLHQDFRQVAGCAR